MLIRCWPAGMIVLQVTLEAFVLETLRVEAQR
jgi:hypothetical protein